MAKKVSRELRPTKMKQLSHEPRRRGNVYCAPFCGRGCTVKEHEAAVAGAATLVKRLGKAWKPRVWENLGWHYSAVSPCGQVKVHPSSGHGFMTFFGSPDSSGGQWVGHGKTPRAAVTEVLGHVKAERDELVAAVGRFEVSTVGWK